MAEDTDTIDRKQWFDITALLAHDASQIPLGDFLTGENSRFSLFESMSALELMEPRMDPIMKARQLAGTTGVPLTFTPQPYYDNELSLVMIVDLLIALHAQHLNGASLPHSLLSSKLYHYDTRAHTESDDDIAYQSISHPVMRAVMMLCLHSSLCARSIVSGGDLYEEDEWSAHEFGITIDDRGGGTPLLQSTLDLISSDNVAESVKLRLKFLMAWLTLLLELEAKPQSLSKAHQFFTAMSQAWLSLVTRSDWHSDDYSERFSAFVSDSSVSLLDPSISVWLVLHAPPRSMPTITITETMSIIHTVVSDLSLSLSVGSARTVNDLLAIIALMQYRQSHVLVRSMLVTLLRNDSTVIGADSLSLSAMIDSHIVAIHPSLTLFDHTAVAAKCFSAVPVEPVLPLPSLITDYKHFYKVFFTQTLEFFLCHRYKYRRRMTDIYQTMPTLMTDSENVDRWLQHVCFVNGIPAAETNSTDSARQYNSMGCRALAIEWTSAIAVHTLFRAFGAELYSPREFAYVYYVLHTACERRLRAHDAAYRDPKVVPMLVKQFTLNQSLTNGSTGARRTKREAQRKLAKQGVNDSESVSVTPPFDSELALTAMLSALSHGTLSMIAAIKALAPTLVPTIEQSLESNYFQHRFHDYSLLVPSIDYHSYHHYHASRQSLTAKDLVSESANWFKEAKSLHGILIGKLNESSLLPFSARVTVKELQSSTNNGSSNHYEIAQCGRYAALSVDASLLRRLLKVCIANSVNLLGLEKKLVDVTTQWKVQFSFDACELFPVISISK